MVNLQGKSKVELKAGLQTMLKRQALFSIPLPLVAGCLWGAGSAVRVLVGICWSLVDTSLIFRSVLVGYGATAQESRKLLVRTFLYRVLLAGSLVLIMLKGKFSVWELLISFVLLHIFLVLNLSIFATPKKTSAVRKGENEDG